MKGLERFYYAYFCPIYNKLEICYKFSAVALCQPQVGFSISIMRWKVRSQLVLLFALVAVYQSVQGK